MENLNEMGERLMKIVEADPKNEKAWEGFNNYLQLLGRISDNTKEAAIEEEKTIRHKFENRVSFKPY
jgi:ferric-dicitrate binding protein FerR (iron transport regulator)